MVVVLYTYQLIEHNRAQEQLQPVLIPRSVPAFDSMRQQEKTRRQLRTIPTPVINFRTPTVGEIVVGCLLAILVIGTKGAATPALAAFMPVSFIPSENRSGRSGGGKR